MGRLLETINDPRELKRISPRNLPLLCHEIRQEIIGVVSKTGGHLASSLGTVELAVALHYCLDAPRDLIIWDVGHQAYAHKILTGRKDRFHALRQYGGISGFPSKEESAFDPFSTGHSSTAVSLALGCACARDIKGSRQKAVAVIGDGSLTGGLCFEALNQAGHLNKDLLVILNTNEMSISPSVGALSNYLNKIISAPIYNRIKDEIEIFLKKIPRWGLRMAVAAKKFEEGVKNLLVPGIFFEELGFRYFGPFDGHDVELLVGVLKNILHLKGPILMHVVTKKGKGYPPSEQFPEKFHSAGPFDVKTAQPLRSNSSPRAPTYTEIFSRKLVRLARDNKDIVAITAAMPTGTGLDKFAEEFPERFFDVGIAEEHAVAFAAGLAQGGLLPVVAIYSTFLQRAYDQLIEEAALQNLHIIFAIDRAGLVGEDGPTHHGIFDIAYLRNIPNFIFMAPRDGEELEQMLEWALVQSGPIAIRYPKASVPPRPQRAVPSTIRQGRVEILREGDDVAIIALGAMVEPALVAADELSKQGISCLVIDARFIRPLDEESIADVCQKTKKVLCIEEGIGKGGFGSSVLEVLSKRGIVADCKILGLPEEFITFGPRRFLLEKFNLDATGIVKTIKQWFGSGAVA
jgi:1-deoxy-D-xylulose-5-phosphate synthase